MLLNSGTTSLTEVTRFYVNDPTTAARTQYTTTETTTAINLGYMDCVNIILEVSPGYFTTRTYNNTTADQTVFALPADWVRMKEVVIEESGKNLSSDSAASGVFYENVSWNILQSASRDNSTSKLWAPSPSTATTGKISIYPAIGTAGTSASWFVYEYEPTLLSNNTDAPIFPSNHHELIAVKAAIYLKTSRDLTPSILQRREAQLEKRMRANIGVWDLGTTGQFASAAFDSQVKKYSNVGQHK